MAEKPGDKSAGRDQGAPRPNGGTSVIDTDSKVRRIPFGAVPRGADILHISPRRGTLDPIARSAVGRILARQVYQGAADRSRALIREQGLTGAVAAVTRRLNRSGLDDLTRLLLSQPDIYGMVIVTLIASEVARPEDPDGFADAVLRELEIPDGVKALFFELVVDEIRDRNSLNLGGERLKRVIARLRRDGFPLAPGAVEPAVTSGIDRVLDDGDLPQFVEDYIARREIDPARFTASIKASMVRHLRERGVTIKSQASVEQFRLGRFDEYFAIAYDRAVAASEGGDDPIEAARRGSDADPWDFTVETFESTEQQGVVRENILAAGALDYNFELGERLGVFRLVDALVVNWSAGAIDVADGPAATKLYKYYKLRDERSSAEERALIYRRVLDKGDAEVLSRMVVNEHFPRLWDKLMYEAAQHIRKLEDASGDTDDGAKVSRTPIYQATRELQYNLTEFATGMAHVQARETYAALQAAFDILKDPEIADHFGGGRRKTMWTTIERLSKAEFGSAPNIAAIRTMAVEGNRVFRWIAEFEQGAVTEDRFREFLAAAEAYVIARGTDEGSEESPFEPEEPEETDDESEDDFGDFDT